MRQWLAVGVLVAAMACGGNGEDTQSVRATCERLSRLSGDEDPAILREIAEDADPSIRPTLDRLSTAAESSDIGGAMGPASEMIGRCAAEGVTLSR
jgi:hypothetical protein